MNDAPAVISQSEWEYVEEEVRSQKFLLKEIRKELANLRLAVEDLSKWKDDSKVQTIAALKGQVKRYEKRNDWVIRTLVFGGVLELLRVVFEKWVHLP